MIRTAVVADVSCHAAWLATTGGGDCFTFFLSCFFFLATASSEQWLSGATKPGQIGTNPQVLCTPWPLVAANRRRPPVATPTVVL